MHFTTVVVLVLALVVTGCSGAAPRPAHVTTSREPPPPPAATLDHGPPPYAGAAWVEGHWEWDGLQYVWVDGYWIDLPTGSVRQATWSYGDDGWSFEPGAMIAPEGSESPLPAPPAPAGSVRGRAGGTVLGD